MIMFAPFKTVRATFARTRRVRSRLCTVDARAQSSTSLNFSGSYRHGPERGTVRKPSPGDASSDNVSAHVAGADEARDLITTARQRRDRPAQVVQIDRLLQKRVEILAAEVLLVESRHGNDRKKGLPRWMPSDSAGELDAVHAWHGEVGDDDVDAWRRVEVGQGSDRRSRTQDVGSARPQKRGQDLHGIVIVVHDEEGEASEKIHGRGSGHETSVRYAVCSAGQSRKPPIPRIAVHDRRVNRNSSVAAPSAYASSRRAVTIVSRLQLSH